MMKVNIAIDGPSGAGKSTIAKAAAKKLGFIYVDTGALYRSVALNAIRSGVKDTKNKEEVVPTLSGLNVSLRFVDGEQRVFIGDCDVSEAIRQNEVSMAASNVSAIPEVRDFLFSLQRNIASENDCIMDGRDIGTVVLPDAKIKIFLTASPEARADRRFKEILKKGQQIDYATVLKEIKERDWQDSHREIAPLKKADDAVLVDVAAFLHRRVDGFRFRDAERLRRAVLLRHGNRREIMRFEHAEADAVFLVFLLQPVGKFVVAFVRHDGERIDLEAVMADAVLVDAEAQAAADLLPLLHGARRLVQRADLEDVRIVPALAKRRV